MGRAGSTGNSLRGTVVLLCALVVVVGSPWVVDALTAGWTDNRVLELLYRALYVPRWDLTPGPDPQSATIAWSGNAGFVAVILGIALLVPRLVRPASGARGAQWAAALGTGVLIALLAALPSWALVLWGDPATALAFGPDPSAALVYILVDSLCFGVLLGLVVAAVFAVAGTPAPAGRGAAGRTRERKRGMTSPDGPATAPTGSAPGDATRYLCAAAYTDPAFARLVVEDVLADELAAVAVSPGVDLVPVARHCLAARRLTARRDRRLTLAFGPVLLFAPFWLLFGALALKALGAAARVPGRSLRGRELPDFGRAVRRLAVTGAALLATALPMGLALSALPLPGFPAWLFGGYLGGIPALLAVLVAGVLAFRTVAAAERDVDARLRMLRRESFSPDAVPQPLPAEPWAQARITKLAEAQHGNVTVYSGFSPFIGHSGKDSHWALSIPLLPAQSPSGSGAERGTVTPFDAWDVVECLRSGLRNAAGRHPGEPLLDGRGLTGLRLEDRVLVSGTQVAANALLLPHPGRAPATRLPAPEVRRIALNPEGPARHHLAAHLPLWGDEVVPSQFLQVAVSGRTLHLRCDRHILGPVRPDLHAVDSLPARLTDEHRRALALTALRRTGAALFAAPASALRYARYGSRRTRTLGRERKAAAQDPAFDRGARLSIREAALSPAYLNHFQRGDAESALAALDRHTLAAVREFLDEHGVDTADFRTQTQTILNNGVLQQGGVSVVANQAVGQGAQATTQVAAAPAADRTPRR